MSETKDVQIEESWKVALAGEFEQPYFGKIREFLLQEKQAGKNVYPPGPLIFNAFNKVPLQNTKVVILGQDPYHAPGEAHGLSFSVQRGVKVPPSLKNIYKELETDIEGFKSPKHGCLESWAEQGVLMLNAYLTVEEKKPGSHRAIGWERFTDAAIRAVSAQCSGVAFLLWGKPAQEKAKLVDQTRHKIFEAAHPSPLAGGKFFGSRPFSQANAYLVEQGKTPIDWHLPE